MKKEYIIPACSGKAIEILKNQCITIVDTDGGQVVDFFAEKQDSPDEFLSTGVTIDCNSSFRLNLGDLLYTNLYHPMFRVEYDDVGEHDLFHPCCRPEMYDFFYHNGKNHPNCLDNINEALNEKHPIIHPLNLFMYTKISADGSFSVEPPRSNAGDKIILRALMDVRLGIAACSVSESNCNSGRCTAVQVIVED